MYGEERLKEYCKVERIEPGWNKVLSKYKINWIIHESNSMLSAFLLEREDWKIIYADKVASIFVRNTPENQYIINKYAYVEEMVKNIDGCDRIVRREKIFSPLSPPSPTGGRGK
jgi:hypothetical protein